MNRKSNKSKVSRGYKAAAMILAILLIAGITTACGGTAEKAETASILDRNGTIYSDGTYIVGTDLQSGLYRVELMDTLTKNGTIDRSVSEDMSVSNILASISYAGNGYVQILDTDKAVRLKGVDIQPIIADELKPAIQTEAGSGLYLIGYDLAPGTYDVQITDIATNSGIFQRLGSVAMNKEDIITNDIISKAGTITIEDSDYAVYLKGIKITAQK